MYCWTVIIGLQDGALDLLLELKNTKMSLEMLQVFSSTPTFLLKVLKMADVLMGSVFWCLACVSFLL